MVLTDLVQSISDSRFCDRDGFPLVQIGSETYCSVEYADGLIGGQKVIGVAEGERYIEILFANGWIIPLTCPCCGGSVHLKTHSLPELRAWLFGRTLEGFRHGEWVGQGSPPSRHPVFALQFSGEEDRKNRTIEVSLDSVRLIRKGSQVPADSG